MSDLVGTQIVGFLTHRLKSDFFCYRSFDLVAMLQFKGQNLDIAYEEKENSLIGLWGFDQLDTTGWFVFISLMAMSYGHSGSVIWP